MTQHMSMTIALTAVLACGSTALAQSSSLYVNRASEAAPASRPMMVGAVEDRLSPAIARTSLVASRLPEPRKFGVHDLITIIVREQTSNDSKATLETEKETKLDGEISSFPDFQLKNLLNLQLGASDMSRGTPKVGIDMKKEFSGDGNFKRSDTFTTRITAEIIDVKPNGLLVVEARRHMRTDKETVAIVLTGTCRSQDVAGDNSVLSTNLHNLRLVKEHEGEIRNSTKKGILTQVFEGLFAF